MVALNSWGILSFIVGQDLSWRSLQIAYSELPGHVLAYNVQYPSASTGGKNQFSLASDASSSASNGILFSAEVIPTEAAKRDL